MLEEENYSIEVEDARDPFWWALAHASVLLEKRLKPEELKYTFPIYCKLCEMANEQRSQAKFSAGRDDLAARTGWGRKVVLKALNILCDELRIVERIHVNDPDSGSSLPNKYRLLRVKSKGEGLSRNPGEGLPRDRGGAPQETASIISKKSTHSETKPRKERRADKVRQKSLDSITVLQLKIKYYPQFDPRSPRFKLLQPSQVGQLRSAWEKEHHRTWEPGPEFDPSAYLRGDYGKLL